MKLELCLDLTKYVLLFYREGVRARLIAADEVNSKGFVIYNPSTKGK